MKKLFYCALIAGVFSSCMSGNSTDERARHSKERLQQFYDQVVNAHNADLVDSFFTADFVDHQMDPAPALGMEGMKSSMKEFFAAYPDAHVKAEFMIAEGDTVMAKLVMTGTNSGPLKGMAATNKSIDIQGIAVFALKGNKFSARWRYFDDLKMMQQLGMMPKEMSDSSSKK